MLHFGPFPWLHLGTFLCLNFLDIGELFFLFVDEFFFYLYELVVGWVDSLAPFVCNISILVIKIIFLPNKIEKKKDHKRGVQMGHLSIF